MEKLGIFISLYMVGGMLAVVSGVLICNRDNGSKYAGESKKNAA